MVNSRSSLVIALALLLPALSSDAAQLRLAAGGSSAQLPSTTAWEQDGQALVAGQHPLLPRLQAESLEVTVPGTGVLRMTALRMSSLERGEEPVLMAAQAQPRVAELHASWTGVGERFSLQSTALKHDLVLHRDALDELAGADLHATWLIELPAGTSLALEGGAGAVLRNADGSFAARFPHPEIGDASGAHLQAGIARYELSPVGAGVELTVIVPATWLGAPERALPLLIDPTLELEPFDGTLTGFVTEAGVRSDDAIVAGSLALIGFGSDARGFAQFDTTAIPDDATITGVHLEAWIANHDNPPDSAEPTVLDIRPCLVPVDSPIDVVHDAIGPVFSADPYVNTAVLRTGDGFCAEAFEFQGYDLGPDAAAHLEAQLAADWFAVGFVADTSPDPLFQHVDIIGFSEEVSGIGCAIPSVADGRIALVVDYETDSLCVPRNHGYWHRYCLGQDAIDPGRRGSGNGPGPKKAHDDLPAGLLATADGAMAAHGLGACQALDEGPFSDARLAALRELSTLRMNMAASFLKASCPVELHPVDDRPDLTVGDAVELMEALILDGSDEALHDARWIGEHVANGEALVRGE
jgi:hypothetical protein